MKSISNIAPMKPTFEVSEVEATATQATIAIEPLEQGYGHTVGNALRRVMLTSLPGHAISSVRIKGVDHQYTALEGMSEDIIELVLNLKQVRIKSDATEPFTIKLEAKGAAEVTAADINTGGVAEVVNPDLFLATLAKGAKLEVEMTVDSGIGYEVGADRTSSVIGEIPVDAMYSPVVKVNYKVEATRVGRRTDYDRIVIHVQTDGTIKPVEAVKQSAQILAKQFVQVFDPTIVKEEVEEEKLSPEESRGK